MKKQRTAWVGLMGLCAVSANAALIAHWTFDDTLTNSVGAAYAAVSTGAGDPQYSTDAKYGKSLLFTNPDGAEVAINRLVIADGGDWAGSSNWTISAWIKPTRLGPDTIATVFSAVGNSGNYTVYGQLRDANLLRTFYKDDGGGAGSTSADWGGATGEWYRLTAVFDAVNGKVTQYRDSMDGTGGLVLLSSETYATPMTLSNFQLGFVGGVFGFQGYMDDVRIYDTALTASEVDTIPEPVVAPTGLIAHWSFDDTLDNSVSGAYGAISTGSGTPQYSTDAKYGKSLLFTNPDGAAIATNRLTIADGGVWAGSSDWTFSAWIKPTRLGPDTTATIFSAAGNSGNYTLYGMLRDANQMKTYYKDDGGGANSTSGSWGGAVNEWYRLTVVFDATNGTVTQYRDSTDGVGGLVLLGSSANYVVPITLSNFQLGFVSGVFGYQGYMDDVRIYNFALSEAEVDAIDELVPEMPPATIVGWSAVSSNVIQLVVDVPDLASRYYFPKSTTDLLIGTWTNWPHSDDGINPFVITNLSYSSVEGSNEVIYVETTNAAAFYRVDGEL